VIVQKLKLRLRGPKAVCVVKSGKGRKQLRILNDIWRGTWCVYLYEIETSF